MKFRKLIYNIRDAIVTITNSIGHECNGFLIKNYYIICPATIVSNPLSDIYVDVVNVNGLNQSYSYKVNIIGVDMKGNVCVLKIDHNDNWNKCNPVIDDKLQPYLLWGKSRGTCPGDKIIVIGGTNTENSVTISYVADNRYVCYKNKIHGELLLINNCFNKYGAPVININGKVIGMIVDTDIALSEFFMRKPIKTIINAHLSGVIPEDYIIIHPKYHFYIYIKASLGLELRLLKQKDYIFDTIGKFPRQIIGYIIESMNDQIQNLESRDIITHINGCMIGDRKYQISPDLILWRIKPGDVVNLTYRKFKDGYEKMYDINVKTFVDHEF